MADSLNKCPRCGKNIMPNKTICSFCGTILSGKRESVYENTQEVSGEERYKPCPVCGKVPVDKSTCPNCGVTGICGYHIYKFHGDIADSPTGCVKCGPRCSSCGTQTTLKTYKKRALCSVCYDRFTAPKMMDKESQRIFAEKLKKTLTSFFTLAGLIVGGILGMQPENQNLFVTLVKNPSLTGPPAIAAWAGVGLIAGSLLVAFINLFIKTE